MLLWRVSSVSETDMMSFTTVSNDNLIVMLAKMFF